MKSRPILFSAPMVQALLDGRKTQTRRIMKPQPANDIHRGQFPNPNSQGWISSLKHKYGATTAHFCPYGKPGDLLWVREAWKHLAAGGIEGGYGQVRYGYGYRADGGVHWQKHTTEIHDLSGRPDVGPLQFEPQPWKPSIHMPRRASRLTLEITGVRVERLNDISRKDAAAEGVCLDLSQPLPDWCQKDRWPEENYKALWESLNGLGSWDANPWVWVLEFKVHRCNVGDILK